MKRVLASVAAVAVVLAASACAAAPAGNPVPGGDPDAGRVAILDHGCTSCHVIPGVPGVDDERVAPDLTGLADRYYLAGHIRNDTEELISWLRDPQDIAPGTLMPDVGLTEEEARDIAAYLLSR